VIEDPRYANLRAGEGIFKPTKKPEKVETSHTTLGLPRGKSYYG